MKNLLIYIHPRKFFDDDHTRYAKIQIDNSLKFWKPEDILIVTNFPYEYKGIKAMVVSDNLYSKVYKKCSKIDVICYLLENQLLNELTWFHDFEAWQINPIDISLDRDIGFTDHGWLSKWNTGSIFFKPTQASLSVFRWINKIVLQYRTDEERALVYLTDENINNINKYYQRLNITYNIGKENREYCISLAYKPLKVFHFHPYKEDLLNKFKPWLPQDLVKLMEEQSPSVI